MRGKFGSSSRHAFRSSCIARLKLHCVKSDVSVMDFVVGALEEKAGARESGGKAERRRRRAPDYWATGRLPGRPSPRASGAERPAFDDPLRLRGPCTLRAPPCGCVSGRRPSDGARLCIPDQRRLLRRHEPRCCAIAARCSSGFDVALGECRGVPVFFASEHARYSAAITRNRRPDDVTQRHLLARSGRTAAASSLRELAARPPRPGAGSGPQPRVPAPAPAAAAGPGAQATSTSSRRVRHVAGSSSPSPPRARSRPSRGRTGGPLDAGLLLDDARRRGDRRQIVTRIRKPAGRGHEHVAR